MSLYTETVSDLQIDSDGWSVIATKKIRIGYPDDVWVFKDKDVDIKQLHRLCDDKVIFMCHRKVEGGYELIIKNNKYYNSKSSALGRLSIIR